VIPSLPPSQTLAPLLRHLESAYPNEGCGLLLQASDGTWKVRPMANVYDRYHAKDPQRFPRTSATAYLFDPKEYLAISEEADARGDRLACIVHSHVDVGAYFSAEDRAMAAPDGEPMFPGVSYLVVAVDQGKTTGAQVFWWSAGDYAEAPVTL
jgi:[CysO sulfur-carrier protein]-S-L-cysteine hydrolase